jgi:hypothetical protein
MRTRSRRTAAPKPPTDEALAVARAALGRLTNLGARLDLDRLEVGEQHELVELIKKARPDDEGEPNIGVRRLHDLDLLSKKDRRKLEALVERAAGVGAGLFEAERQALEDQAEMEALAVEARRPSARPRYEERGAVVLPKEWALDYVRDGYLHISHVALLVVLVAALENGETLAPRGHFEDAGATLVLVRSGPLPVAADEDQRLLAGWRKQLDHLAYCGFFEVEKRGNEIRVRRGQRLLELNERRKS